MLKNKKIILCITGSIAAYKSVYLLRLLKKAGAEVQVIMTRGASWFVTPLTFSTLSGRRVLNRLFENEMWENHAVLARWADLILIAPATADIISRMAHGRTDDILLAIYLSATCPVWIAPAMDEDMWFHPATKRNLATLQEDGVRVIDTGEGELASGLTGKGRMVEPEDIYKQVEQFFSFGVRRLRGKKVLISAGPTVEPIDPVRFISNHSTGKMGFSLAEAFINQGAGVTVVTGPVTIPFPHGAQIVQIKTSDEMYGQCMEHFTENDIIVMAAAVADFTPDKFSENKIKKTGQQMTITLMPTRDILSAMGKLKNKNQLLIGFALESENGEENAMKKLEEKNADYIILNSLSDAGAGFGPSTNKVTILNNYGPVFRSPVEKKEVLAAKIVNFIADKIETSN